MLKDLIGFFESAPLEEITKKLKENNVKFTNDIESKYDNITKNMNIIGKSDNYYVKIKSNEKKYEKFNNFKYCDNNGYYITKRNISDNDYGEEILVNSIKERVVAA